MPTKQHKHDGFSYAIWELGRNFSWAVIGVHEDAKHHNIPAGKGISATEEQAEKEAKAYIDAQVANPSAEEDWLKR